MTKLIVILGFALSFAAGLVIGSRPKASSDASSVPLRPTTSPTTQHERRGGPGGWLSTELNLTPVQRARLDEIWSAMAQRGRNEHEDRRREYRRERDASIADLVPVARLGEYDDIINAYSERVFAMERESREAYEAAVEKTKQILTPEQRVRYDALLSRHRWGPGAARDRHPNSRRSETRATSQPEQTGAPTGAPSPSHEPH